MLPEGRTDDRFKEPRLNRWHSYLRTDQCSERGGRRLADGRYKRSCDLTHRLDHRPRRLCYRFDEQARRSTNGFDGLSSTRYHRLGNIVHGHYERASLIDQWPSDLGALVDYRFSNLAQLADLLASHRACNIGYRLGFLADRTIDATESILKRLATALSATTNRIGSFIYMRTSAATRVTTTAVAAFTAAIMITAATNGSF
jgi:hypothetical protein